MPPLQLFYSYAEEDEQLILELRGHLSPLEHAGHISVWDYRKISAGKNWEAEISAHLESADIILLLISSHFMNSDYCFNREMKRALEKHESQSARVIPIILRACLWDTTPLANLLALPTSVVPVTSWSNKDEAWTDVAKGIRKVVDELQQTQANIELYISIPNGLGLLSAQNAMNQVPSAWVLFSNVMLDNRTPKYMNLDIFVHLNLNSHPNPVILRERGGLLDDIAKDGYLQSVNGPVKWSRCPLKLEPHEALETGLLGFFGTNLEFDLDAATFDEDPIGTLALLIKDACIEFRDLESGKSFFSPPDAPRYP